MKHFKPPRWFKMFHFSVNEETCRAVQLKVVGCRRRNLLFPVPDTVNMFLAADQTKQTI